MWGSPCHAAVVGSPPCCELQKPEKRTKGIRLAVCFFLCFLCACVCILLGQGALCLFMHLWVWDALRVYLEGCTLGKERIDCDTLLLPCFGGGSILNALWMAVHCSSLWTRFPHCTRIVHVRRMKWCMIWWTCGPRNRTLDEQNLKFGGFFKHVRGPPQMTAFRSNGIESRKGNRIKCISFPLPEFVACHFSPAFSVALKTGLWGTFF